ncbi:MAG: polysaccharide export protein [Woeseia sp.]|nr:polysaccharide biosynthesis/export family protein [Woeseia sp.]MBT8095878.1 polysaccharide biosynthesis/export family protein [Woeseia sp.]NNE61973.1 polysaccharide export protein [Woeseia sp.]NNL56018.1 polysaccharide export protein [Woeseia sp.]
MEHNGVIAACVFSAMIFFGVPAWGQDSTERDNAYTVLPGDVLQVSVWKEPDLQLEVLVRPDAAFSFPLAGDISTEGLSVVQLQEELTERLSRYLSNPVVTISVSQVLGNKIYVIGQVNRPGDFVVNPQVDVMQALSMAGGLTAFADTNDIKILRRTGPRQTAISFKYNDVLKGKDLSQNIVLQSGDIVAVP